jgi:hypothetical protein
MPVNGDRSAALRCFFADRNHNGRWSVSGDSDLRCYLRPNSLPEADFAVRMAICHTSFDMPVNPNNYDHRGGGNYGIVVRLPQIVADDRLVYFDHNRNRASWVIRDFIAGQRLDDSHSACTVPQIEADATHDEFPIWCNVEINPTDWRTYLALRTTAVLRLSGPLCSTIAANPRSGSWRPL